MTEAEILAIQAEAAREIAKNGAACTLRRPGDQTDPWTAAGGDTLIEVNAFRSYVKVKDPNGAFTGRTVTKLTMAAGGAVPLKSDEIAFGETQDGATGGGGVTLDQSDITFDSATVTWDTGAVIDPQAFHGIMDIREVGPTNVPLYYEIMLEN